MTYSQSVGLIAGVLHYSQSYIFTACSSKYRSHISECGFAITSVMHDNVSLCSTLSGFTAVGASPMTASEPVFSKSPANTGFAVSTVFEHGSRELCGGVAGGCIWSGMFTLTVFVPLRAEVCTTNESNSLIFKYGTIDKAATASYHSPLLISTVMYSCAAAGFCVTITSDLTECNYSVNLQSFRPCFSFGETLANKACLYEGTTHPVSKRFTGMILTSISTTTTCSSAFVGDTLISTCCLSQTMLPLQSCSVPVLDQNTIGIEFHHDHAVITTIFSYVGNSDMVALSSKSPIRSMLIDQQIVQGIRCTETRLSLTFERSNVFFAVTYKSASATFVSTSTTNKLNNAKQLDAALGCTAKFLTTNELFTQRP